MLVACKDRELIETIVADIQRHFMTGEKLKPMGGE